MDCSEEFYGEVLDFLHTREKPAGASSRGELRWHGVVDIHTTYCIFCEALALGIIGLHYLHAYGAIGRMDVYTRLHGAWVTFGNHQFDALLGYLS